MHERERTVFSPFGTQKRPFTDTDYRGQEINVPPGTTIPDLARMLFGVQRVEPFTGRFAFLTRDDKERDYDVAEDKFVFKDLASITAFKDDARRILSRIVELGQELGIPVIEDKDRRVRVLDSAAVWEWMRADHPKRRFLEKHAYVIGFLLSNQDIAKKFCIVRGVNPGWWTASYAGKTTPALKDFMPAVRALVKAIHRIEKSAKYAEVERATFKDLGDPIDTNVGYPFFSAEVTAAGDPVTRLRTLETFARLGTQGYDWKKVLRAVNEKSKGTPLYGYPFAIAPIRRTQPGYKWNHTFNKTSAGMVTVSDFRGYNTVRVAWMAAYVLNLYLSPLQWRWKSVRKLLPGTFHDGEAKTRRIATSKKKKWFVAEGDYSNYDRYIPVNLFLEFVRLYLVGKPHAQYWYDLVKFLHTQVPILWPDYTPSGTSSGWVFVPSLIGLLSGLKITSEEGTFINAIINIAALISIGELTETSAVEYLCQYLNADVGTGDERFWVMSDDALLSAPSLPALYKQGNAFKHYADLANLSGSLMLGDRFLMRHSYAGQDSPVPCRVWQNTLSNEEPVTDELKFIVGLAMRTDGMLGQKTFDAFNTGRLVPLTRIELQVNKEVIDSMHRFLSTARHPVAPAISFMTTLKDECDAMLRRLGPEAAATATATMSSDTALRLDRMRNSYVRALAEWELSLATAARLSQKQRLDSLIYALHKDKHVPSSAMILKSLLDIDPKLAGLLSNIDEKEHTFYKFAMDKIGIPFDL